MELNSVTKQRIIYAISIITAVVGLGILLAVGNSRRVDSLYPLKVTTGHVTDDTTGPGTQFPYQAQLTATESSSLAERANLIFLPQSSKLYVQENAGTVYMQVAAGLVLFKVSTDPITINLNNQLVTVNNATVVFSAATKTIYIISGQIATDSFTAVTNQALVYIDNKFLTAAIDRSKLTNSEWQVLISLLRTHNELPELLADLTPPPIENLSPTGAGLTTNAKSVTITGQTEVGAAIYINDLQIDVDATGKFNRELPLKSGANEFILQAIDNWNNITRQTLIVNQSAEEIVVAEIIADPSCSKGELESRLFCELNKLRVGEGKPVVSFSKEVSLVAETRAHAISGYDFTAELNKLGITAANSTSTHLETDSGDTALDALQQIRTQTGSTLLLSDIKSVGIGFHDNRLTVIFYE